MNFKLVFLTLLGAANSLTYPAHAQTRSAEVELLISGSDNLQLSEFYKVNGYRLAWTDEENVGQLLASLRSIGEDGLDPDYYHVNLLNELIREPKVDSAGLDTALTQAFLEVAHDLYQGRLLPEKLFPADWDACTQPADYAGILRDALQQKIISETLDFLRPMDGAYKELKDMLATMRQINSGDSGSGFLASADTKPVEDSVDIIIVNLERYRWHQSRLMERSILINIPSEELTVRDHESTELTTKVIIGRVDRRTPVVSSSVTLLTLNPTWTVPPTVFKEDILPSLKLDRTYLGRHNMKVINGKGDDVNADSINWSEVDATRFPYYLRENAGPHNPLGRIKFSFPNDHSVYLHDTNLPSFFSNQDRTLSSGCIRVENPLALADLLLEGSGWTEAMLQDAIRTGETKHVLLRKPMPIHITYFTACVKNAELVLLKDVYHYDSVVLNALRARQAGL